MTTASQSSGPARIVVGVDGSASSKTALAWAAREAELTGAPLHVVASWALPATYGWAPPLPEARTLAEEMTHMLEQTVAEVVGKDRGITVTTDVVAGHPATVLTELSKQASLVVVGSRGHGGFVGLLLGSVGEHLTTHAQCPVVVVRPKVSVAA